MAFKRRQTPEGVLVSLTSVKERQCHGENEQRPVTFDYGDHLLPVEPSVIRGHDCSMRVEVVKVATTQQPVFEINGECPVHCRGQEGSSCLPSEQGRRRLFRVGSFRLMAGGENSRKLIGGTGVKKLGRSALASDRPCSPPFGFLGVRSLSQGERRYGAT